MGRTQNDLLASGLNQQTGNGAAWLLVNRTAARAIVSCLSAPRSAEAHLMDPRNTPGYRLHRALSQLNDLEVNQLTDADRERIETATALLE